VNAGQLENVHEGLGMMLRDLHKGVDKLKQRPASQFIVTTCRTTAALLSASIASGAIDGSQQLQAQVPVRTESMMAMCATVLQVVV
jgi:hypothetical protein